MNLDDAQKLKIRQWIGEGLKLAEIQTRLQSELGLRLTYMEVRLVVDDLKLVPKDAEPPPSPASLNQTVGAPPPGNPAATPATKPGKDMAKPADTGLGTVSVSVDKVTVPGALVSGTVKFSDGQSGKWFIDEMGQLGLAPAQKGYRPSPADMQSFQTTLQNELQQLGY